MQMVTICVPKIQSPIPPVTSKELFIKSVRQAIPNAPSKFIELLSCQYTNLKRDASGHRFDDNLVRWCLTVWLRSPRAYRDLRVMTGLILPCETTLRSTKNSVPQEAGFDQVNRPMISYIQKG